MDFENFALRYARANFAVLPLVPNAKNPIIPKDPEKAARLGIEPGNGAWDATTDEDTIRKWARLWPTANVGIHPGKCTPAFIVLDFDVKDGGLATLDELLETVPEIADAWIVATPSGGFHYYFLAPNGLDIPSSVRIMAGLDVRFNGTQVVAPPSIHPDGGKYRWSKKENDLPPYLPKPILARLEQAKATSVNAGSQALEDEESEIHARHATLESLGARLRARGFDRMAIKATLMSINERRCRPVPLAEEEIDRIVKSNMNIAPKTNLIDECEKKFNQRKAEPKAGRQKLTLKTYSEIQEEEVEWLMPGYIASGIFNLFFGTEGYGKSFSTLGIAAALSRGVPLPGTYALQSKPVSSLFITYEDDPSRIIRKRLRLLGADTSKIYTPDPNELQITYKDVDILANTIDDIPDLKLVVIDPITQFVSGIDEANNIAVRDAIQPLVNLAAKKNFALIGIKHTNKKEDGSLQNRIAGSKAWIEYSRNVVLCGLDNQKTQEQRHKYGGMAVVKTNLEGAIPIPYEIDNGEFFFGEPDPELTPDRLLPAKKKDDAKR